MSKELVNKSKQKSSMVDINPQILIAKAIDKNLPIETMERLLAMRRELKAESSKEIFFKSLSKFQKECPVIKKEIIVTEKNSTKSRYKYASLDAIVEQTKNILEKYGFSHTVKTEQTDINVTVICQAHHEAGHMEESKFVIPIDMSGYMNIAQKVATALSYAKRYAFCDVFGIITGDTDDDANGLDKAENKVQEKIEDIKIEIAKIIRNKVFTTEDVKKINISLAKCKTLNSFNAVFESCKKESHKRIGKNILKESKPEKLVTPKEDIKKGIDIETIEKKADQQKQEISEELKQAESKLNNTIFKDSPEGEEQLDIF